MHSALLTTTGFIAAVYATQFQLPVTDPWTKNAVLAPLEGASITAGQPYTVQWQTDNIDSKYTIELYSGCPLNCVYASTVASSIANGGTYSWTPDSVLKGDGYGLKLICEAQKQFQWSGHFTIVAGSGSSSSSSSSSSGPASGPAPGNGGYCQHPSDNDSGADFPNFPNFPSFPNIDMPSIPAGNYAVACTNGVCTTSGSVPTPAPAAPAAPAASPVTTDTPVPAAPQDSGSAPVPAAPAPQNSSAAPPAPAGNSVAPPASQGVAALPAAAGTPAPADTTTPPSTEQSAGPLQFDTSGASRFGASVVGLMAAAAVVAAVF